MSMSADCEVNVGICSVVVWSLCRARFTPIGFSPAELDSGRFSIGLCTHVWTKTSGLGSEAVCCVGF